MSKKYSNKPEKLEAEFYKIASKIERDGIKISELSVIRQLRRSKSDSESKRRRKIFFLYFGFLALFGVTIIGYSVWNPRGFKEIVARVWFYFEGLPLEAELCTIDMPSSVQTFFMPPVNCSICKSRQKIDRIANLSPEIFEQKYAYSGVPVIVADGARNWSATEKFNFEFFKELYGSEGNHGEGCMFFPYQTGFKSLTEALKMNADRVHMRDGSEPWYIGWSNCDPVITNILRMHYQRPYFLPVTSESSSTDWIFMGSPGYGAHMHIDKVGLPSWQAQIKGKKKWMLEPATECSYECSRIEVVVEQGEIIVLDTNIWFHQTLIVGEQMSITIGSEYD